MKRAGHVDLSAYLRAFALLARNPALFIAPLAGFLFSVILGLVPVSGGLLGGLLSIVALCAQAFGIAVSILIGDRAWRSAAGKASFDAAWIDAQRKAPDILLATLGFTFALSAALMIGSITRSALLAELFLGVAVYFLIFTLPAAAIGGVPGSMALQASIERVQRNRLNAFVITVVFIVLWILVGDRGLVALVISSLTGVERIGELNLVGIIVLAFIRAIVGAYLALMLAKAYTDAETR